MMNEYTQSICYMLSLPMTLQLLASYCELLWTMQLRKLQSDSCLEFHPSSITRLECAPHIIKISTEELQGFTLVKEFTM